MSDKVFIVIYLACFVLICRRFCSRYRYPHALTGDVYYHLLCAREIRKNGMRIPRTISGYIWDTGYTYPPLYHYFLALFSEELRMVVERYSSLLFDLSQSTAVFCISTYMLVHFEGVSMEQALWMGSAVAAANMVSPVFNAPIWGPRAVTGTARPMGEAFFVIGVICMIYWEYTDSTAFAVIAAVLMGFLPLVSKFGFQTLMALVIYLIFLAKWFWILVILGGVVAVCICTGGLSYRVLAGQCRHSAFYFKFLQYHYYGLKNGQSGFFGVRDYLQRLYNSLQFPPGLARIASWFMTERNFSHITVFYNLHFWAVIALLLAGQQSSITDSNNMLFWLAFAPLLPAFITGLPRFRFLGESYRYLEYYQWVYWLLLITISLKLFVVIALIYFILSFKLLKVARDQSGVCNEEHLKSKHFFGWIRENLKGEKIYPLGGCHHECIYRGDIPVLLWPGNMDMSKVPLSELELIFDCYPYPRTGTEYQSVLKEHGIQYVICHDQIVAMLDSAIFEGLENVDVPKCQLQLFRLKEKAYFE